ncbi:hypothetical protein PybrP1_000677 [[Pythium] brassicae (nom. inval.)]|nr:hypothetical protein PybrP1_000677 [[Pythium] brassicae (nom. inval.)]
MDFSLPLATHGLSHHTAAVDAATDSEQQEQRTTRVQNAASSPMSTALIVHPLSLFNSALSPSLGRDMELSRLRLQLHEVQQLYVQQQEEEETAAAALAAAERKKKKKSLLDFTCDENVCSILGFLDGATLASAQRVNRYFFKLSGDDAYWYRLCRAEWAISPEQLQTRPASYQALYKVACKSLKRLIRDYFEEQCLSSLQTSLRIPRGAALTIVRAAQ